MISMQAALLAATLCGGGETVFLDFYADWCGPCRAMGSTVEALAQQGYPVRQVNIDRHRELAARYHVTQIPCFVMLVDGQEVDRVIGGTSYSRLERMCQLATTTAAAPQVAKSAESPRTKPASLTSLPPQSRPPLSAVETPASSSETATGDGPYATAGWTPRTNPPQVGDQELISATVWLRVGDAGGTSCGSGTLIDAREGQALILTCGHLFRDSQGRGPIEVDLFDGRTTVRRVPGRLVSYNLERDVALVCIEAPRPLYTMRVAPAGYRFEPGLPVVTLGCSHGDDPTAVHSQVTSLDKYLGPPNIQVAGQSVEGRSGGGLFTRDGLVIGVCNAADPQDNEAFYAALGAVHAELDQAGLSYVYGEPQAKPRTVETPRAALVAVEPPPMPKQMPRREDHAALVDLPRRQVPAANSDTAQLGPAEQAALDEIRRRMQEGAEVICVVRSRSNPLAKSEVIMLDEASPEFLRLLAAEARGQTQHQAQDSRELVPTQSREPTAGGQ